MKKKKLKSIHESIDNLLFEKTSSNTINEPFRYVSSDIQIHPIDEDKT